MILSCCGVSEILPSAGWHCQLAQEQSQPSGGPLGLSLLANAGRYRRRTWCTAIQLSHVARTRTRTTRGNRAEHYLALMAVLPTIVIDAAPTRVADAPHSEPVMRGNFLHMCFRGGTKPPS